MKQRISPKTISIVFSILVVCFAVGSYIYGAWTEPTVAPPGDNVDAPVNVGTTSQTKRGALGVSGLFRAWGGVVGASDGLTVVSGNVGIGTTNPGAKLHVAGTAGTDGIKFPDGTLQTTSAGVKAWVVFDGNTAPYVIRDSNNVSSVAYQGSGVYRVDWTMPFADTNYAFFVTTSAGPIRLTEINAAYLRFQVFSISSSPAAAVADYISVVAIDN